MSRRGGSFRPKASRFRRPRSRIPGTRRRPRPADFAPPAPSRKPSPPPPTACTPAPTQENRRPRPDLLNESHRYPVRPDDLVLPADQIPQGVARISTSKLHPAGPAAAAPPGHRTVGAGLAFGAPPIPAGGGQDWSCCAAPSGRGSCSRTRAASARPGGRTRAPSPMGTAPWRRGRSWCTSGCCPVRTVLNRPQARHRNVLGNRAARRSLALTQGELAAVDDLGLRTGAGDPGGGFGERHDQPAAAARPTPTRKSSASPCTASKRRTCVRQAMVIGEVASYELLGTG